MPKSKGNESHDMFDIILFEKTPSELYHISYKEMPRLPKQFQERLHDTTATPHRLQHNTTQHTQAEQQ
jgi:hypothetical protein